MDTQNIKFEIVKRLPNKIANRYVKRIMNKEGQGTCKLVRLYYQWRYKVEVGPYSYGGCFEPTFNIGGTVKIGNYCSIAGDVHYFGANHPISHVSTSAYFYNKSFGFEVKDVPRECLEIGNDVWIGYGVTILSGCHKIGNGAVIGAGSIVTKDIPPYAVVVGNPARIIRCRFEEEKQELLEKSEWWKKQPKQIMKYYEWISDVEKFVENIKEEN